MSDPRRLLDDPTGLSAEERRVLLADRQFRPSAAQRSVLWAVLAAQLGAAATTATTSAGAAVTAGASFLGTAGGVAIKWFSVGALVGVGIGFGGHELLDARDADKLRRPEVSESVVLDAPATPAPRKAVNAVAETPEPTPVIASAPEPPPAKVRSARDGITSLPRPATEPTAITDEARRVGQARAALRQGDAHAAFAQLRRLDADYPSGVLTQEREAIAIEALMALGQQTAARERAQSFLRKFPESPHASRVRSLVAE